MVLNNLLIPIKLLASAAKISCCSLSSLLISASSIAFCIGFKGVIVSNNIRKELI